MSLPLSSPSPNEAMFILDAALLCRLPVTTPDADSDEEKEDDDDDKEEEEEEEEEEADEEVAAVEEEVT